MIKKIQIEIIIFILLIVSILFTNIVDIWIYVFFSKLNYGIDSTYLKTFFINITELGNSLWYFLILLFVFLISFLSRKINLISVKNYSNLRNFSIFSFLYLLSTGVVTQVIKHIIGRIRPNHINLNDEIYFNFFSTNSEFHSFPSGHTSTIIAVTLILCLALPSLRYFLFITGLVIAISRVIVGAHYFTDIIAGALVSIIVYKILRFIYTKIYPKNNFNQYKVSTTTVLVKSQIVFIVIVIFITIGPSIDIYLSSIFYYGNNQFMLQSYYTTSIIFRKILLPLLLVYIFILPAMSKLTVVNKIFFNYCFSLKELVFIWISGITILILFVNVLLKNMWGRVRPNELLIFGGKGDFTPWYKFSDICVSNCSFVSGDASVGFMLMVFYFVTKKNIYCYLALFFGTSIGFIRIIAGGHFFSDIVFAQLVVTIPLSVFFIFYTKLYDK